jgi:hypothetical protein
VSIPDKIMFGATVRQCLILGGAAAGLWLAWLGLRPFVPPLLFAAPAGLFLLLLGIAVSAERDGVTADRLLASAVRQAISPRRRAMAPEGIGQAPAFITEALCRQEQPPVAPLGLPVQAVRDGGVLDLGVDGTAVIAEATTVNFALRTPAEQELLVSGFARWLNSLTGPVQITSRTAPADLTSQIDALRQNAPEMPHPLLEAAALNHADFLARVNDSGTILHRSLLLTAHESDREHSPRAMRRINDATGLLAACEIDATPLDHPSAHRILSAALDPDQQ